MNTQPSTTKKIEAWLLRGYKLTRNGKTFAEYKAA
jgi:hypothetical protein